MKFSHRLSDAVHVLAFVMIYQGGDLSSGMIAESIEANPSMVRRLMARLSKAGLLVSRAGSVDPKLGRPANEITLLDIYRSIEDNQRFLHIDEKTNPECIVGGNIQATLTEVYDEVQRAAEAKMATVTLADITGDILARHAQR
ncbi:Rrf2 family transcriptional regulator [Lapidilactobacillus wuchangensis]|uniref:Rrf2 family transcriptional regulator n=1 Tax=Lapidilactobacillus wuchangensis TaxID=2486001 RepID=UPI000F7B50B0|nr:Rrf2 family transcriptional regulator [Lapidilactobacillus wuchangensis]